MDNHWKGVDKVMLKFTIWWTIGWVGLAIGLLFYHGIL